MRNGNNENACAAVIGSATQAMHAQSVLARLGIRCEVIMADPSGGANGCAYAVSYGCREEGEVRRALHRSGIRVRSYYAKKR